MTLQSEDDVPSDRATETAGSEADSRLGSTEFSRLDPQMQKRIRSQALAMIGVTLLLLVGSICIGILLPTIRQWTP